MTYYKVSHIYWNARPLSSGDKSSKKCRLKNGRPSPTMRWSPQTIGCWWGRVSSCAGPDHPHALHFVWQKYKMCLSIDILLHGLCVPLSVKSPIIFNDTPFLDLTNSWSNIVFVSSVKISYLIAVFRKIIPNSLSPSQIVGKIVLFFFQIYWSVSNKQ